MDAPRLEARLDFKFRLPSRGEAQRPRAMGHPRQHRLKVRARLRRPSLALLLALVLVLLGLSWRLTG